MAGAAHIPKCSMPRSAEPNLNSKILVMAVAQVAEVVHDTVDGGNLAPPRGPKLL